MREVGVSVIARRRRNADIQAHRLMAAIRARQATQPSRDSACAPMAKSTSWAPEVMSWP